MLCQRGKGKVLRAEISWWLCKHVMGLFFICPALPFSQGGGGRKDLDLFRAVLGKTKLNEFTSKAC